MLKSVLKKSDLANALLAAAKHGREHIMHLLVEAGEQYMHIQIGAPGAGVRRGESSNSRAGVQGRASGVAWICSDSL